MIEHVEHLGAELQARRGGHREVAHERQVDVRKRWPACDVAAGVAELPGLGGQVQPLECPAAQPRIDGVWPGVRIADQIGAAGRESRDRRAVGLQRDVGRVGHGERRSGVVGRDTVHLPATKDCLHCGRQFG